MKSREQLDREFHERRAHNKPVVIRRLKNFRDHHPNFQPDNEIHSQLFIPAKIVTIDKIDFIEINIKGGFYYLMIKNIQEAIYEYPRYKRIWVFK